MSLGLDDASPTTRPPDAPAAAEVESLVRGLIGMMRSGGVTELDVAFGAVSVRLRAGSVPAAPAEPVDVEAGADHAASGEPTAHLITAPMIGTFYAAPSPGAAPFVTVGDEIEVGQVIGVIEAMKIMNEITADGAGVVDAILAGNAQPVEYGSPLIRLRRRH